MPIFNNENILCKKQDFQFFWKTGRSGLSAISPRGAEARWHHPGRSTPAGPSLPHTVSTAPARLRPAARCLGPAGTRTRDSSGPVGSGSEVRRLRLWSRSATGELGDSGEQPSVSGPMTPPLAARPRPPASSSCCGRPLPGGSHPPCAAVARGSTNVWAVNKRGPFLFFLDGQVTTAWQCGYLSRCPLCREIYRSVLTTQDLKLILE